MIALVVVLVVTVWAAAFISGFFRGMAAAERQHRDDWPGTR